jgi:hypothetical protein
VLVGWRGTWAGGTLGRLCHSSPSPTNHRREQRQWRRLQPSLRAPAGSGHYRRTAGWPVRLFPLLPLSLSSLSALSPSFSPKTTEITVTPETLILARLWLFSSFTEEIDNFFSIDYFFEGFFQIKIQMMHHFVLGIIFQNNFLTFFHTKFS